MNKEKYERLIGYTRNMVPIGNMLIVASMILIVHAIYHHWKEHTYLAIAVVMFLGVLIVSVTSLMRKNLDIQVYVEQLKEANNNLEWSNEHLKDALGASQDKLKWVLNIAPDAKLDDDYKKVLFRKFFLEELRVDWGREYIPERRNKRKLENNND